MWDTAEAGLSQISVADPGRPAFPSGQIAARPDGGPFPRDVAGQARLATTSLTVARAELGASACHIVMLRGYTVGATTDDFQQLLSELREILGSGKPSITTIRVQALYTPEI